LLVFGRWKIATNPASRISQLALALATVGQTYSLVTFPETNETRDGGGEDP
jgi:hypothetical protein